jgi:hypothetical protein
VTDFIDSLPDLTGKKPDMVDHLPDLSQSADANLGGTLQLGIPFTGARLDTGVKLSPSVEAGLVGAGKTAAGWVRGLTNFSNPAADAQQAEENKLYAPLGAAHPLATGVGEAAPYLASALVTGNPLVMAGMSAAQYGTPGERALQGGAAYAGGKVGQGLARLFGPASMAPAASNGAEDFFNYGLNTGNKWGIPLRMAQTTDSTPIKILDAVAANLPGSSSVIAKAKDASYSGFNHAVANTFGADAAKITPELLGQSQSTIGGNIGRIADRSTVVLDPTFANEFAAASARVNNELVGDNAALASKWLNNVTRKIGPDGTMSGNQYKALRSDIGKAANQAGGTVGDVLGDVKSALTGAMDRSVAPEDSATWKTLNRQYFNVKQVANAAKNSPEGNLSPSQLLNAVNTAQKSSRFGAGNDLAELARWAKPVIGDSIPNSGTAQREWYQRLLTNPLATAGAAGGAMYGLSQTGIGPLDAPLGLLAAYGTARGMAGQPASALMRRILAQSGGLLGRDLAPQ